jgi:thymidylate synthase ThyX
MKTDVLENLDKYFYTELPFYKEYLEMIFEFIEKNNLWELPNDKLKLYMPESLYCKLYMKQNLRNYFNFYRLRTSEKAHYLIREFTQATYDVLPEYIKELVDLEMGSKK